MDVAAFLRGLGLDEFVDTFATNGVDGKLLADLTNDDLKDLGLQRLVDRKRLLAAIASLAAIEPPHHSRPTDLASGWGEHRQVTILFADIAGFSNMTSRHGAESIHALLNRFFQTADTIVASHGGTVDKHIGDNVMALFGAPIAHDDDPIRAVRAAFEVHRQVGEIDDGTGKRLGVHIGIASGQVVASGTGSDTHREYTVTGASVNLAARLQSRATAGETLISDALHRAVAHAFDCESLGECVVKGIDTPVAIWRVIGPRTHERPNDRMSFIGREAEMAQLTGIIARCRDHGCGNAVVLRGEAGIGKTRLIEELTRVGVGNGFACHRGLVLDFGAGEGRDAIRNIVRSLLGIPDSSDRRERQDVVATIMQQGILAPERRIFLNDLLDLPQSKEERVVYDAMSNVTRNEGKSTVLVELLRAMASRQPVIVVIEDIHWADALTLHHLARIAVTFADCPGILVMSSRVEGYPLNAAWRRRIAECPFVTMDLAPLRNEEALRLAASFVETVNQTALACIKRAEGNPLFLEQLLRNVEEKGEGDVPASIQSLVLARLDRLPAIDKLALQAASTLGQRFDIQVVRHLIGSEDYTEQKLVDRSFIRPEHDRFLFDHALVQEAVLGSLLKHQRQTLHRKAADFYADSDLILRAQHLDRANDAGAASAYLDAAKSQALALHFNTVLTLVERGLQLPTERAACYDLNCLRGDALRNTGANEESIASFEAALLSASNPRQRCLAMIGIAEGLRVADRHALVLEMLEKAEVLATEANMLSELARICCLRGNILFSQGRVAECRWENEKALDIARRAGSIEGEAAALSGLGDAYYLAGRMRTAGDQFRACVELCQQHGLRRIEVANRHMIGWTRLHLLEIVEAEADGLASMTLAVEVGYPRAQLLGLQLAAYVNSELGEIERSNLLLGQALDLAKSLQADNFTAQILRWLAGNAISVGDLPAAKTYAAEAIQLVRRVGMAFIGPVVLAVQATISEDSAASEALLKEAEGILDSGCVSHNHFWFAKLAINQALRAGAWDRAERYAARLETYTQAEPLPWSDFQIAKARALVAWGRGDRTVECCAELLRLRTIAEQKRLLSDLADLNPTLAAA